MDLIIENYYFITYQRSTIMETKEKTKSEVSKEIRDHKVTKAEKHTPAKSVSKLKRKPLL
jgi:hypothetical protein